MAEGKGQEIKGRAKEAAGAAAGDDDLKREGQRDQARGKLDQAKDKLGDAVDALKDAAKSGRANR